MKCHVKVELLDSENNVTKSVETDGVITNAYKYLSTWGFPGVGRITQVWENCFNADLTFGGVIGFKLPLSTDEDDFRYSLSNLKTCWATRYSSDYIINSNKIGAKMLELCEFTSTSYKQVWEWDESQGNGVISSICLTHAAGAGAFDVDPPSDKTAARAKGNDGMLTTAPLSSASEASVFSSTYSAAGSNPYATMFYLNGLVSTDSHPWHWNGNTLFYQTDKYIVMLYASSVNVALDSGYRTTIKYRRIDKSQMYRWNGFCHYDASLDRNLVAHKFGAPYLYSDGSFPANSWDGELVLDTPYTLSSFRHGSGTSPGFNTSYEYTFCEDDFAVALRMDLPFPKDDPELPSDFRLNPDGVDNGMPYASSRRVGTILISGETPAVIKPSGAQYFDSKWNSPLNDWNSPVKTRGIMFMKDLTYIYKWQPANNNTTNPSYNKIVRRKLDGDVLVWEQSLGDNSNNTQPIEPCFALGSDYFICPDWANRTTSGGVAWSTGVTATIRKVSDGSPAGYTELGEIDSARPIVALKPLDKNMFFVDFNSNSSIRYGYVSYLNTNYMYAKFNLPEAITKTSSSKLRISATVEL